LLRYRKSIALVAGAAFLPLGGCERAPSVSVVGSFFPVWIFCTVAGILAAVAFRLLLLRLQMAQSVKLPVLIYPCVAVSCALTLWLIFFS